MTHEELLEEIDFFPLDGLHKWFQPALRAVAELHKPIKDDWFNTDGMICKECTREEYTVVYPCATIEAIEKALND